MATRWGRASKVGAGFAVVLAAALSGGASASADTIEHGTFEEGDSYTATLCGTEWDVTYSASGHYKVMSDPGGTPIDVYHEVRTFRLDHTNDAGQFYRVSGRVNERLASVKPLGGNIYQLTLTQAGSTWTMSSASGKRVWRDRGINYIVYSIDTLGDDDPENDTFVDGSFSITWKGPHFLSDSEPGSQYCTYVAQAIAWG